MLDELVYYKQLGLKIAELRESNRMTQETLGKLLDLSRVSIVNIEKGRQKPSVFLLYKIAYEFKIPITDILGSKKEGYLNSFEIYSGEDQLTTKDFEDLETFLKD